VLVFRPSAGAFAITVAVAAAAGAWMTWATILHPGWVERPWPARLYILGLIAFVAVLTVRCPFFAFFTWIGFLHAFRYLDGAWRWVASAVIAVFFATGQSGGVHRPTAAQVAIWLVLACVDVTLVGVFVLLGVKTEEQNRARKGMIAELAQANQRLEEMMAENTGLQAQLLTQAREAGAGDERQRMAREIHDTLAQGLTGIITQLQAAEQASKDPARWRRHVTAATSLARESLGEARRSVHALRPEPLETARLSEALADVAGRWSALHGIEARVTTTGSARPLPPDAELALLRTAQEALANVAKHAQASRVGLTLSYMDHEVALDVRDDGRGFDPAQDGDRSVNGTADSGGAAGGGGFGLIAMRQRIEGLKGTLQVESESGGGTAISACVPAAPEGIPA
jgi:signal transduction histidine kinase